MLIWEFVFLISLIVLGTALIVFAVKRFGSPLNTPPSAADLAKLQRIFAGPSEEISLGLLRTRLDGHKESLYLGTPEHLAAAQGQLRTFLRSRVPNSDTGAILNFSSTRGITLMAAGFAAFMLLYIFFDMKFAWLWLLLAAANLARDYFVSSGNMTSDAITLGRVPFRQVIFYTSLTASMIDLSNGVGFFLDITTETGAVRIYDHKLGRLLKLHDMIVKQRPDLQPHHESAAQASTRPDSLFAANEHL